MGVTKVYLLNVPLENDYKNTIYFESPDAQYNYFVNKVFKQHKYTDFTYQRKDSFIRIPAQYDDVIGCNYVMYQNTGYGSNKWYYAFITDIKYIDDGRTDVYIETDVMQTWYFNFTIRDSFIEREHVNNDSVGMHTVPEGLETGEYICNDLERDLELRDYAYVMTATEGIGGSDNKTYGTNFGGVWVAGGAWVSTNATTIIALIREYDISSDTTTDAVTSFYMIPKKIINHDFSKLPFDGQTEPVVYDKTISKQKNIDGYTPKNNKVLCYPYNYLLLSNNSGSSNILQYEHFSDKDNCKFEIEGVPCVGGSIKCVPCDYKGIDRIQEEGIMCGKFPVLSWSNDLYTNWLTQNSLNNTIGFVADGLKIVGGIVGAVATSGVGAVASGGVIASGVGGIVSRLATIHEHSFTPASARGNTNAGDINTCYKMNTFYFYKMSIKKEYAQIIDNYFTMFGYKVNRVGKPLSNHRSRFWFIKTVDINIDGNSDINIPQNDMNKIKSCYNNGITFWRSNTTINDYTSSNAIL